MALQGVFFQGLSKDLKDKLASQDETTSLEDLISLTVHLDNRLRERRKEKAAIPFPT